MERKLEKVCKYKKQLKVGERYSLSNLKIFDYSFIVTDINEYEVLVIYSDGMKGRITYEPFMVYEYPLTSLEKELL
jgi:hypothetical protein